MNQLPELMILLLIKKLDLLNPNPSLKFSRNWNLRTNLKKIPTWMILLQMRLYLFIMNTGI